MRLLPFLVLLASSALACGGEGPAPQTPKAPELPELERYFPLVDGKLFAYLSHGETGGTTLLVLRVERKSPGRGALKGTSSTREFVITASSIDRVGGGTVLKLPLKEGTSFVGDHGGRATIVETELSVDVAAGHYTHCLRTEEEPTPMAPGKTRTTFCPDVGVVRLEVTSGDRNEAIELQSYGDPVTIR
jgi:hypothetical protein